METVIVAYIPVLHKGYNKLFETYPEVKKLYIIGQELIEEFPHLTKGIRALEPGFIQKAIISWNIFDEVLIIDKNVIESFSDKKIKIILPDEDVMKSLAERYLSKSEIIYSPIFLRWDKHNSSIGKSLPIDQKVSIEEFDRDLINKLNIEAEKSSDWWRRIGAAVIKDGGVVFVAHNEHVPSPHTPYENGDPRDNFHKGVHVELSTSIHAEAGVIVQAAREGVSLEGASIYVTTFPCPPCAKLIAYSGVKKLYYSGGYGMLDGENVLRNQGVEIIFVDTDISEK